MVVVAVDKAESIANFVELTVFYVEMNAFLCQTTQPGQIRQKTRHKSDIQQINTHFAVWPVREKFRPYRTLAA